MDLQTIIVAFVVGYAGSYVLLKFMPASWRQVVTNIFIVRFGRPLGMSDLQIKKLEKKLESSGACGSCSSCKACATEPTTTKKNQHPLHMQK